jgi:hypothetical protein
MRLSSERRSYERRKEARMASNGGKNSAGSQPGVQAAKIQGARNQEVQAEAAGTPTERSEHDG